MAALPGACARMSVNWCVCVCMSKRESVWGSVREIRARGGEAAARAGPNT